MLMLVLLLVSSITGVAEDRGPAPEKKQKMEPIKQAAPVKKAVASDKLTPIPMEPMQKHKVKVLAFEKWTYATEAPQATQMVLASSSATCASCANLGGPKLTNPRRDCLSLLLEIDPPVCCDQYFDVPCKIDGGGKTFISPQVNGKCGSCSMKSQSLGISNEVTTSKDDNGKINLLMIGEFKPPIKFVQIFFFRNKEDGDGPLLNSLSIDGKDLPIPK
jgi:hypothetical protein